MVADLIKLDGLNLKSNFSKYIVKGLKYTLT